MSSIPCGTTTPSEGGVIACTLGAIPAEERDAHIARARHLLFALDRERYDLPDGTAWRMPITVYADVAQFIDTERRPILSR